MSNLFLDKLSFTIGQKKLLDDISLEVKDGEFVGLIGPNGCGKSTLLKNIYKIHKPDCGIIKLNDMDVLSVSNKTLAKELSVMVQENVVEFDMPVIEMVKLGRFVHKKMFVDSSKEDTEIALHYLNEVGMAGFEERSFSSLSGGEKQRVLVARALAQETKFIILDEPTNHLDIGYQYQIMNILKRQNLTVFSSIHDLNIASVYCDRVIVMNKGKIVASGNPAEVITSDLIKSIFNIKSCVEISKLTNRPQICYLPEAV